jgi:hypothetical protein
VRRATLGMYPAGAAAKSNNPPFIAAAIRKVREERPEVYLRCACAILPKDVLVKDAGESELTVADARELLQMLREHRARLIEGSAEDGGD